jgi:Aldo/keto reductase family
MNKKLPNRREFNGFWLALGSPLYSAGTMIVARSSASARAATFMVKFRAGTIVPALGQGSANLAQGRHPEAAEEEALRTGLSLGMTLIDTAEIYGDGRSEKLIGRVIAGQRDRVFLVSKVWPDHVTGNGIARLATRASPVWALIISISTCCTGQVGILTSPALSRRSKICARRERSGPGAYPTSRSVIWKTSSVFQTAIAALPIKSCTTSTAAVSSMTCCHGVSSTASQWWPIHRWAAPVPAYCVIPCLRGLAQHIVAQQPLSRWRGSSAVVM